MTFPVVQALGPRASAALCEHARHQSAGTGSAAVETPCAFAFKSVNNRNPTLNEYKQEPRVPERTNRKAGGQKNKRKSTQISIKTKGFELKLCLDEIHLATNLSPRNHHLRLI
jgi:hypothetical protein